MGGERVPRGTARGGQSQACHNRASSGSPIRPGPSSVCEDSGGASNSVPTMCGPSLRPGKGGDSTSCGGHGDVLPLSPRTPEPSTTLHPQSSRVAPGFTNQSAQRVPGLGLPRFSPPPALQPLIPPSFFLRSLPGMALEAARCFLILSQGSTQLVGNLPGSNRGRIAVIRIFELRISLFFSLKSRGEMEWKLT